MSMEIMVMMMVVVVVLEIAMATAMMMMMIVVVAGDGGVGGSDGDCDDDDDFIIYMHLSALTFGTPIVLFSSSQVVQETILVGSEEKRKCHLKLADFFVDHCNDDDRVIFMAPEQLKQAGEKKRLLEFLRNDNRSKNRSGFWKNNYYKVSCVLDLSTTTHLNRKCNVWRSWTVVLSKFSGNVSS